MAQEIIVEKEGATPREALYKALLELEALEEEVDYTLEEVFHKGFLGTTKKAYKVRVWLKGVLPPPEKPPVIKVISEQTTITEQSPNITRELLEKLGLTFDEVAEELTDKGIVIRIQTEDAGRLIGKDGHILHAFHRVLKSIYFHRFGRLIPISLDINDYVKNREIKISQQVAEAIRKVKQFKKKIEFPAMPSWERKFVHKKANEGGLKSESYGKEPNRRVVLFPQNDYKSK